MKSSAASTANELDVDAQFPAMNPFRTHAEHELGFLREGERLLKEKIGSPFGGAARESGRNAALEFQPVLDRGGFNREIRAGAPLGIAETPGNRRAKFEDGLGFRIRVLSERGTETQKCGREK